MSVQSVATKTLFLALSVGAFAGCTRIHKKSEATPDIPTRPADEQPVTAQKSNVGILDIKVELRSDGMLLHVAALPNGSALECDLDDKPLVPCHDGALYARPADGDHKISAVALRDGATTAIGESAPFSVLPGTGGAFDPENNPRSPLNLALDDKDFANGMTVPMTKDFIAKFKFSAAPTCKATLKCQYDSRTSPFWVDCDKSGTSFTVAKDLVAMGLQYLAVQASCDGQIGPILTLFWWGVPDATYQPLALSVIKDQKRRNIVNLIKSDDCPESMQKYECAAKAEDDFSLCDNGNVIDAPQAGFRVRLTCEGRQGPVLTF